MQFGGLNSLFKGFNTSSSAPETNKFSVKTLNAQQSSPSSLIASLSKIKNTTSDEAFVINLNGNTNNSIESKEKATEALARIEDLKVEQARIAESIAKRGNKAASQAAFDALNSEIQKIAATQFEGKALMAEDASGWVTVKGFTSYVQTRSIPDSSYAIQRTYTALELQASSLRNKTDDITDKLEEEKKRLEKEIRLAELKQRGQSSAWGTDVKNKGGNQFNFIDTGGVEDSNIYTAVDLFNSTTPQPSASPASEPDPSVAFQAKMQSMAGQFAYDPSKDTGQGPAVGTFYFDAEVLYQMTAGGPVQYVQTGMAYDTIMIDGATAIAGGSYGEIQTSPDTGMAYVWTAGVTEKGEDGWAEYGPA